MDNLCPYVALQRNKTGGLCWLFSSPDFDSGGDGSSLSGTHDCEITVLEWGTGHGRRCTTSPSFPHHAGEAHWGHRSETGTAPGEANGEGATNEEFLQQDWIPFLLAPCCFSYMGFLGLYYRCYVFTPYYHCHWCSRCTKEFSLQCLMLNPGVFSSPWRQLEKLFIGTFPDHGQELLDARRSAKRIVPSGLQFLIDFVCLLELSGDCFPNL